MNRLISNVILSTILLSLLGCLPGTGSPPPKIEWVEPTVNHSALKYINSAAFDESLSNAMKQHNTPIEVSVLVPFSSNNIPERLDSWLTTVTENGGEMKTEPASGEDEKNVAALVLSLYSIYRLIKAQVRYVPAENYHATLLYRRTENGDALIETIVFTHK